MCVCDRGESERECVGWVAEQQQSACYFHCYTTAHRHGGRPASDREDRPTSHTSPDAETFWQTQSRQAKTVGGQGYYCLCVFRGCVRLLFLVKGDYTSSWYSGGKKMLYRPIPALSNTYTHTPLRGQKTVNEHTSPNPRPTITVNQRFS